MRLLQCWSCPWGWPQCKPGLQHISDTSRPAWLGLWSTLGLEIVHSRLIPVQSSALRASSEPEWLLAVGVKGSLLWPWFFPKASGICCCGIKLFWADDIWEWVSFLELSYLLESRASSVVINSLSRSSCNQVRLIHHQRREMSPHLSRYCRKTIISLIYPPQGPFIFPESLVTCFFLPFP